jgi:hypothetical protein
MDLLYYLDCIGGNSRVIEDRRMNDPTRTRPRLTVSVLTRNAESRLAPLLRQVSAFADEIVVGVDVDSEDQTATVASQFADVVFPFRHAGQLAAARMEIFDHATSDWILVLDDDERLEDGFAERLPELMRDPMATHYWFPRKWIVDEDKREYLFAPPWSPDWQMRLFRNDRSLVWKPNRPHSGYHVMGPGLFEPDMALLHYEPVWCSPEDRDAKLRTYAAGAPHEGWRAHYTIPQHAPRRPYKAPVLVSESRPRKHPARLIVGVREPTVEPQLPPWGMEVVKVDMIAATHCGFEVVAAVTVRNTGALAWWPSWGIRSASLYFSHHLRDPKGGEVVQWDCERTLTLKVTPPGGETTYLHMFSAPAEPGDYLLEWDMVSEGEQWFGVQPPYYSPLHVVA